MVEGTEGSHHKEGSTKMSKHSMVCAGIDTGKRKLDVAIDGRAEQLQVDNDADGHRVLSAWLRKYRVERVGIEASGGHEQAVVAQLRRDGFVVVVFQPAQVRAYATFHLRKAKNDKLDAALIAACTAAVKKIHPPPDPRLAPLAEQLTLIEQITEDIAQRKTRRETCRNTRIRGFWDEEIARLKAVLRGEVKALIAAIRAHRDLAERLDLIASIDGLGLRTAAAILIRMPEIGRLTREQAAALAGLAPYDDDSGDQVGVRHIDGGRSRLRKSLYTAALAAAFHWNPQLNAIYRRLIAAGKPHKVALIACARKLVVYANTVVERGQPWRRRPSSQPVPLFDRGRSFVPTCTTVRRRAQTPSRLAVAQVQQRAPNLPGHALTAASTASP
jgi:transposase